MHSRGASQAAWQCPAVVPPPLESLEGELWPQGDVHACMHACRGLAAPYLTAFLVLSYASPAESLASSAARLMFLPACV